MERKVGERTRKRLYFGNSVGLLVVTRYITRSKLRVEDLFWLAVEEIELVLEEKAVWTSCLGCISS